MHNICTLCERSFHKCVRICTKAIELHLFRKAFNTFIAIDEISRERHVPGYSGHISSELCERLRCSRRPIFLSTCMSDLVLAWLAAPQIVQLGSPHLAPAQNLYALQCRGIPAGVAHSLSNNIPH